VKRMLSSANLGLTGDKEQFAREVAVVRTRLRTISWRTIDTNSKFMSFWDIVVILALLFTALVTPFHLAFIDFNPDVTKAPIDFTSNRIVDSIFMIDLVLQFFMPFRESAKKGGMMVYDNKRIARAYLKSWFFIDLFTCIPWDTAVALIAQAYGWETKGKLFRLLRMLRVLKLMRVMRASRIINRWQNHVSIPFAFTSLMKFGLVCMIIAHWGACSWGYVGYETDDVWTGYGGAGMSWRQKHRIGPSATPFELYAVCLYTAINIIVGGSCEINSGNYLEFYMQAVMLAVGSSVWAYAIGSVCGIVATLDPAKIEYQQTMDEVNHFCKANAIPREFSVKLRSYFRNTIHLVRSRRYEGLLQKMSTRLRGDAAYKMCEFRMRSVHFLVDPDIEPEFMCNLAIKFVTRAYSRLERVPCTDLIIIDRGVVAKLGRLYLGGSCLGKDVILSHDNLRELGDAFSLSFTQTISLTQKDIFGLLPDYPKAYHIVRKAALRMALTRALIKAAQLIKRSKAWQQGRFVGKLCDVFDMAMEEAEESNPEVVRKKMEEEARTKFIPLTLTAQALEQVEKKEKKDAKLAVDYAKTRGQKLWGQISKQNKLQFLEKDDFKPPTMEEQMAQLHAKVHSSQAATNARLDKLEVLLLAISGKLDKPLGSMRQKSRPSRANGNNGSPANGSRRVSQGNHTCRTELNETSQATSSSPFEA